MPEPESNKFEKMTDAVFGEDSFEENDFLSAIDEEFLDEVAPSEEELHQVEQDLRTTAAEAEATVIQEAPPTARPYTKEEKNMVLFTHLSGLAGQIIPFGHILGPLLVWQMKKKEMPILDQHGKDAINFHLSMTLFILLSIPLIFIIIGIPILIGLVFTQLIATIVVAIKAQNGDKYKYPLSIRFLK
ncbi:MAG: DUF4870 domain-containing protein [Bacteroidota bacterium]